MNEQGTNLQGTDPLLLPLLRARDRAELDDSLSELLDQHALPVIKGIIRNKLKVTLAASSATNSRNNSPET